MRRPIPVTILAVVFIAAAAALLFVSVVALITSSEAEGYVTLVGTVAILLLAFLLAALGLGLWQLEEDARRAAVAVFATLAVLMVATLVIALASDRRFALDAPAVLWLFVAVFLGGCAAYLRSGPVKSAFGQFTVLNLHS